MKKTVSAFALLAVVAMATPVLAGDWSVPKIDWKDAKADFKDLRSDYKELHHDRAAFAEALKAGTLTPAQARADIAEIRHDKYEIHKDIRDLRHDGIVIKGTHR